MIGLIDDPSQNSVISTSPFICRGWAYSETGIESIKIIIDELEVGEAEYGLLRDDVKKAFPQYSDIDTSGFSFSKDLHLINGSHRLKVTVLEKNGNLHDLGRVEFKFKSRGFLDTNFSSLLTQLFCRNTSIPESSDVRKRISCRYLQGDGIEIGALHNPLPLSDQAKVRYIDRLPSPELQEHYSDLNPQQLVKIDLIDDGEVLSKISDNSLDFIIANHFLEHCENPIGTMRNHLRKIKTGGILYYAIPEKSCTFDNERSLTMFDHLVEDDTLGPITSRKNHFCEWVTFVEKKEDPAKIDSRVSALMAMKYSIHFHVWDMATCFQFLYKTNEYLDNSFYLLHFEKNENEIITLLKKI